MSANYEVMCKSTGRQGAIYALGVKKNDGKIVLRTVNWIIYDIETGNANYRVGPMKADSKVDSDDVKPVLLEIARSTKGRKYLRTSADQTESNNLLELPEAEDLELDDGECGPMYPPQQQPIPQITLRKGDKGHEVQALCRYLSRYGYFPNEHLAELYPSWKTAIETAPADDSIFDGHLEHAVRLFQRNHGLSETGSVDNATLALMQKPRCGMPDNILNEPAEIRNETSSSFVLGHGKWPGSVVSYQFINFTPDLAPDDTRKAVKDSFLCWSAVCPLCFIENPIDGNIRIGWHSGMHGDNSPFDGMGGVLAHAYYPIPGIGSLSGDIHFDEAETWSAELPPTGRDLHTVALHEIGHALGLGHSTVYNSVMYAYYMGPQRELTPDDIAAIQTLYGIPHRWHSLEGGLTSGPLAIRNADGRLEVFVRGTDGALHHIWQLTPGGSWSGWACLGGGLSSIPVAVRNMDGQLEVFVRGTDGALHHIWQLTPGGSWSNWSSLGGVLTSDPFAVRNADGRLEAFVCGTDQALHHCWQSKPGGSWY
jgi:hypothetical protein